MWCLWERICWAKGDVLLLGSAFHYISVKFCAFLKFLGAALLEMSLFFLFALAKNHDFHTIPQANLPLQNVQPKFPFPN